MKKPKFKVGQVVKIDCDFYRSGDRGHQRYQRIVKIYDHAGRPGYRFLNGDACAERWVRPLTKKELGR